MKCFDSVWSRSSFPFYDLCTFISVIYITTKLIVSTEVKCVRLKLYAFRYVTLEYNIQLPFVRLYVAVFYTLSEMIDY